MTLPADPPKLPKWPFLVGDAALLGLAWFIAYRSNPAPLVGGPLIAVVACVIIGAVLAAYPFVIEYTRAQEIALDERQRALEALSQTVATSAEQISIAANGLHEIAELAQRNLKVADALPLKIQEKLASVSAGFEDARADEREELEREVAALRASEGEQLLAAADKIARAVVELTKLESTAQKHLSASAEVITRASDTLAPIDARISAAVERAERALADSQRAAAEPPRARAVATPAESSVGRTPEPIAAVATSDAPPAPATYPDKLPPEITKAPQTTEGLMVADPFTAAIMSVLEPKAAGGSAATAPVANGIKPNAEVLAPAEPAPIPAQTISEIVPVAPRDSASMSPILLPADSTLMKPERKRAPRKPKSTPTPPPADSIPPSPMVSSEVAAAPAAPAIVEAPAPVAETVADKAPEFAEIATAFEALPEPEPEPVVVKAEPIESKSESAEPAESSISSDGATRLLVTAYIGIGNRLFIRGDGAGLSWEKGVPLQFVSIGKWRWESHDASSPTTYKLYKNDSIECSSLGQQSLEPGRQHEVTAKF